MMETPEAREAYSQRKAMVEPVFSYMSGVLNFARFHRHGLSKARLEFSLHAAAYNLGRILSALTAQGRCFTQLLLMYLAWVGATLISLTHFWHIPTPTRKHIFELE